jgi:RHS repeat-associated protein
VLPNGKVHSFSYDPFGRRILRTAQNKTRVFAYDGDNIVEELKETGSPAIRYTQGLGIDEPLATTASGVTTYYHADGLGSITSLSNASGTVVNSYEYDSFGRLTSRNETVSNTIGYTAREDDGQTGLYYYRARYYDPASGRFLTEDPIGFAEGINFFTYVRNNPVNITDPSGLFLKGWHYQTTYETASQVFGSRADCQEKARRVAEANKREDESKGWMPGFLTREAWASPGPHFPDDSVVRTRLDRAFKECDLDELGRGLHSFQDSLAHSGPYGRPGFHKWTLALGDITAQFNLTLVDAAVDGTFSILRSFQQKCLKCCN